MRARYCNAWFTSSSARNGRRRPKFGNDRDRCARILIVRWQIAIALVSLFAELPFGLVKFGQVGRG